jgi:hypothetical protein
VAETICQALSSLADETWDHLEFGTVHGYSRPGQHVYLAIT